MAKLFTEHDPYHIHAKLGSLVLIHYLYRFVVLLLRGTAFPEDEPVWRQCAGVALHGVLSCSSLLLPIPSKRNFSSPMIWPEFRLHSITFAMRHVVCSIITLLRLWPAGIWLNTLAKLVAAQTTVLVARLITEKYGEKEKRTTNAMPYPSHVTEDAQDIIKKNYAHAQFAASVLALSEDPTMTFFPILPIQTAPLLMTLVRKGLITSARYHQVYALSLSILLPMWLGLILTTQTHLFSYANCVVAREMTSFFRLKKKLSVELSWTLGVAVLCIFHPLWLTAQGLVLGDYLPAFVRGVLTLGMLHGFNKSTVGFLPLLRSPGNAAVKEQTRVATDCSEKESSSERPVRSGGPTSSQAAATCRRQNGAAMASRPHVSSH